MHNMTLEVIDAEAKLKLDWLFRLPYNAEEKERQPFHYKTLHYSKDIVITTGGCWLRYAVDAGSDAFDTDWGLLHNNKSNRYYLLEKQSTEFWHFPRINLDHYKTADTIGRMMHIDGKEELYMYLGHNGIKIHFPTLCALEDTLDITILGEDRHRMLYINDAIGTTIVSPMV